MIYPASVRSNLKRLFMFARICIRSSGPILISKRFLFLWLGYEVLPSVLHCGATVWLHSLRKWPLRSFAVWRRSKIRPDLLIQLILLSYFQLESFKLILWTEYFWANRVKFWFGHAKCKQFSIHYAANRRHVPPERVLQRISRESLEELPLDWWTEVEV